MPSECGTPLFQGLRPLLAKAIRMHRARLATASSGCIRRLLSSRLRSSATFSRVRLGAHSLVSSSQSTTGVPCSLMRVLRCEKSSGPVRLDLAGGTA